MWDKGHDLFQRGRRRHCLGVESFAPVFFVHMTGMCCLSAKAAFSPLPNGERYARCVRFSPSKTWTARLCADMLSRRVLRELHPYSQHAYCTSTAFCRFARLTRAERTASYYRCDVCGEYIAHVLRELHRLLQPAYESGLEWLRTSYASCISACAVVCGARNREFLRTSYVSCINFPATNKILHFYDPTHVLRELHQKSR